MATSFDSLPESVKNVILTYEEKNGNGERPTFNFGPSTGLGITSPMQGNVYPADTPTPDTTSGGALSQAAIQAPAQQVQQVAAQAPAGALSQFSGLSIPKMISPQDALNQYVPQNDQRGQYLALAAGFGSATKTGGLGEQIGNVASAMQQQKQQQEQLRMQYLPHIMQQVIAQQKLEFDRQLANKGLDIAGYGGTQQPQSPTDGSGTPPIAAPQGQSPGGIPAVTGTPATGSAPSAPIQGGASAPSAPTTQPGTATSPGFNQALGLSMIPGMGPASQIFAKQAELSEYQKQVIAAGNPYGSPGFIAAMQTKNTHDVHIAPSSLRAAAPYATGQVNPDGSNKIAYAPAAAISGTTYVPDSTNEAGVRTVQIPGSLPAIQKEFEAKARGPGAVDTTTGYDTNNKAVTLTKNQAADMAAGTALPPGSPAGVATAAGQPLTLVQQPGAETMANKKSGTATDIWTKASDASRNSAQTVANLDNMVTYADKAITGTGQDQLNFWNGVLVQALGNNAPHASTIQEAGQLIKKNAAQVVGSVRMGATGGGSDALQANAESGNPSLDMMNAAFKEAAAQAKSRYQADQARTQALYPSYINNDSNGMVKIDTNFSVHGDPRLWQMQNMTPTQLQAYGATLTPAMRSDLKAHRDALISMGILPKVGAATQ